MFLPFSAPDVRLAKASNTPGLDLIVDGEPVQVKCGMSPSNLTEHFEKYPDVPVTANSAKIGVDQTKSRINSTAKVKNRAQTARQMPEPRLSTTKGLDHCAKCRQHQLFGALLGECRAVLARLWGAIRSDRFDYYTSNRIGVRMLIAETGFFRTLNRSILLIISLVLLSGCASELTSNFKKSLSILVPNKIDFKELEYYAKRSKSAYDPIQDIRKTYPLVTRVVTLPSIDVLYFIETNQADRTQTLSIRGTAVRENVWEDIETTLIPDSILGIPLHSGFRRDAKTIYKDATPYLRKDFGLRITGHSLGGAAAAILADYYKQEGYDVERVVTFGQPRYTTKQPSQHVASVSTRVVNELDVVPMVPAYSLAREYQHFDSEVILRDGPDYVYLDVHDAERLSVGDFWRHLTDFSSKDHHMGGYLANIEGKVSGGARQVQYFPKVKRESRNVAVSD